MSNSSNMDKTSDFNYKGKFVFETPEFRRIVIPWLRHMFGIAIILLLELMVVTIIIHHNANVTPPTNMMTETDLVLLIALGICVPTIITYLVIYFLVKLVKRNVSRKE